VKNENLEELGLTRNTNRHKHRQTNLFEQCSYLIIGTHRNQSKSEQIDHEWVCLWGRRRGHALREHVARCEDEGVFPPRIEYRITVKSDIQFLAVFVPLSAITHSVLINLMVQPIPGHFGWPWHFRKLKAQGSNLSFATFQWKETFELRALSFETAVENVTPSGCAYIFSFLGIGLWQILPVVSCRNIFSTRDLWIYSHEHVTRSEIPRKEKIICTRRSSLVQMFKPPVNYG